MNPDANTVVLPRAAARYAARRLEELLARDIRRPPGDLSFAESLRDIAGEPASRRVPEPEQAEAVASLQLAERPAVYLDEFNAMDLELARELVRDLRAGKPAELADLARQYDLQVVDELLSRVLTLTGRLN